MNRQPYSGHSIDIEMVTETAAAGKKKMSVLLFFSVTENEHIRQRWKEYEK